MQMLVNLESSSSFMKGEHEIGMKFIPKILEQLRNFPESVQLAVVHLLYFGLFMSGVASIVWAICTTLIHR